MSIAVPVRDRAERVRDSAHKIESPFVLDESLCLYSPQDNVDSLAHPRIAHWLEFVKERWEPELRAAERRILLLMPCTKTKPYPFSSEHRAINQRLDDEGFRPVGRATLPQELQARLPAGFSQNVLALGPLSDGRGTLVHRVVLSEPMAVVPYEHIATYEDRASPATAYDDPGLFESRGNAVSPWRADSTAEPVSATRWRWGDAEKRAYVAMHNAMAEGIAATFARVGRLFTDRIAWVAPGLTHRSFVLAVDERRAHGVPRARVVAGERLTLVGANDLLPADLRITCLPSVAECDVAKARLATRLGVPQARLGGAWSRGGVDATPLAVPELLDVLIARIRGAEPASAAAETHPAARTSL